jgi:hypothetical protein
VRAIHASTSPAHPDARIVVLEKTQVGRTWTLGAHATIGRRTGAAIAVEDALVSQEHAIISKDDARWVVRDLGSRNGTYVNGRRIDVTRIRCGDRITVGRTVLLLAQVDPMHERLVERQKDEPADQRARRDAEGRRGPHPHRGHSRSHMRRDDEPARPDRHRGYRRRDGRRNPRCAA